jgi:cysteinyl-tRNA synthetase
MDRVMAATPTCVLDARASLGECPVWSVEEQALFDGRQAARKARDFARADQLRQELEAKGVVIEDTPKGPRWRRRS